MKKICFAFACALLAIFMFSGCIQDTTQSLSDAKLLEYAKSSFDKGQMMGKDLNIGYHNGIPVRVTFPCSDVCPNYTIRIIRYDVNLSQCAAAGGEVKAILVPVAIAVMPKEFCFPKIIVANDIYEFVESECNEKKVILEGKLGIVQDKYPINVIETAKGTYWIYESPKNFEENLNKNVKVEATLSPALSQNNPPKCNICYRECPTCQCPVDRELLYNVKIMEVLE